MLPFGIMAMCLASLSVDKGQEHPGLQEIIGVPLADVQLTAFQAPAQRSLVYLPSQTKCEAAAVVEGECECETAASTHAPAVAGLQPSRRRGRSPGGAAGSSKATASIKKAYQNQRSQSEPKEAAENNLSTKDCSLASAPPRACRTRSYALPPRACIKKCRTCTLIRGLSASDAR